MKTTKIFFVWGALSFLALGRSFGSIDIVDCNIQVPGEYEKREIPFLVGSSGRQIMLPVETLYKNRIFNADKSIVAINFKGTTNYDGVDLLVEHNKKVFILSNIWQYISLDARQSKAVSGLPWNKRFQLEVKSIKGNKVICQFRGENTKAPFFKEGVFSVFIVIKDEIVHLKVSVGDN